MPTIGTTTKPSNFWWAFANNTNQHSEKLTMPETGRIVSVGQWVGGWNDAPRTRLCIWDSAGVLLAQSAEFNVANEGAAGNGNVSLYVQALLTQPLIIAGQQFHVGFSRNPADAHQISGGAGGSGPHYERARNPWPGSMDAATSVDRRIGSYVADYQPVSGMHVRRSGAFAVAQDILVRRGAAFSSAQGVAVFRSGTWEDAE